MNQYDKWARWGRIRSAEETETEERSGMRNAREKKRFGPCKGTREMGIAGQKARPTLDGATPRRDRDIRQQTERYIHRPGEKVSPISFGRF